MSLPPSSDRVARSRGFRPARESIRSQGIDSSRLSPSEVEYLQAWDEMDEGTRRALAEAGVYGPKLDQRGPVDRSVKAPDIDALYQRHGLFHEEPSEHDCSALAEALAKLLFAITRRNHPLCRLLAQVLAPAFFRDHQDLECEIDCLALVLAAADDASLAECGRRYGVGRATTQKRARELRAFEIVQAIQSFANGGRPEVSQKASIRATNVHNRTKPCKQTKPSPFLLSSGN